MDELRNANISETTRKALVADNASEITKLKNVFGQTDFFNPELDYDRLDDYKESTFESWLKANAGTIEEQRPVLRQLIEIVKSDVWGGAQHLLKRQHQLQAKGDRLANVVRGTRHGKGKSMAGDANAVPI